MKYLTFSLKSQQKVTQTDCDVSVQRSAPATIPQPKPVSWPKMHSPLPYLHPSPRLRNMH